MRNSAYKIVLPNGTSGLIQCTSDITLPTHKYRFKAVVGTVVKGSIIQGGMRFYGKEKDVLDACEWSRIPENIKEEYLERIKPTKTTRYTDWYFIPIEEMPFCITRQSLLETMLSEASIKLPEMIKEAVEEGFDFGEKKDKRKFGVVMSYFPLEFRQEIEPKIDPKTKEYKPETVTLSHLRINVVVK